jgi:hypothetical protein
VPLLPVGQFEVTATAPGFKTFRRTDVVLEVSQRLRLDIVLEIGALTETVTVQGEVTRVRTEESSLGTVVERQRIEQLPLNGRHVFNLVKLVAGVQPSDRNADGFGEITNQGFSQIHFNGGPVYGNQFLLDGGANTVPVHNEIGVVPIAMAMIHDEKQQKKQDGEKDDNGKEDDQALKQAAQFTRAIAPVILPMIQSLGDLADEEIDFSDLVGQAEAA